LRRGDILEGIKEKVELNCLVGGKGYGLFPQPESSNPWP